MTTISSGQTSAVSAGQTDTGWIVLSGGTLDVLAGGLASATVVSDGGLVSVSSGGTTSGTHILGGLLGGGEVVSAGGTALDTVLDNGSQLGVFSGATASRTIIDGGGSEEFVYSGGVVSGTIVSSGGFEQLGFFDSGFEDVGGTTISTTVSGGGGEIVWFGGAALGTTVQGDGTVWVYSGGTASSTTLSDGAQLLVFSGGIASGTKVNGGGSEEFVYVGGVASGTTVSSGGFEELGFFTSGFQQLGGTTIGTIVSSGGSESVWSSGVASATVILAGGTVDVFVGGTATFFDGAVVQGTLVDNGTVIFNLTGSDSFTGSLSGSGSLIVEGGGRLVVSGGTAFTGAVTISGAALELSSAGAAGNGAITFAGANATLRIDGTTMPANVISGLAPGDTIDLAGVSFVSGGRSGLAGSNDLQVIANGNTYSLQLDPSQNLAGDSFKLSSDGNGGTKVSIGQGLSINITYDSSVTTASNAAAIEGAVAAAVQFIENTFTNPITLNIDVGYGEINGSPIASGALAQSKFTNGISENYAAVRAALSAGAISADQIAAVAGLPASDPTGGGSFRLTRAEAKALGLLAGASDNVVDGYVGLSSAASFTFDPNNRGVAGEHDAIAAFEHEITEVMGRLGSLGQGFGANVYSPLDLFRYASPGVRDLVYGPGYFSIDGQTLLTAYNNPSNGGDPTDWIPALVGDSFGDGYTGVASLVGATDVEEMNVLGYDVAVPQTVGSGQTLTISAGQTSTGIVVLNGGTLNVLSGGIVINTLDRGGTENISSGGAASGTAIFSGGSANVFSGGTATATTVNNGGFQIVAGGVADTTAINIGGTMVLSSGATHRSLDNGTFVFRGSGHNLTGIAGTGAVVVSGGTLSLSLASNGTSAVDFVISGGGTLELTSAGAAAGRPIDFADTNAVLRIDGTSMPSDVISGFAVGDTIDLAGVSSAGGGSATLLAGNVLRVVESGQNHDLTLNPAQNFAFASFSVASDGVSGTDVSVLIAVSSGQVDNISSGQIVDGASVLSGGTEFVSSGGTTIATTVSSGGKLIVLSGGLADPTMVYGGGVETVSAGGIDDGAILSGGEQDVYGTASGTVVNSGGMQVVGSGGTASATTINSGGTATVLDGGTLAGNTVNNGTLIFDLIGSASFAGTVTGSGALVVEGGGALDVLTAYAGAATIDAGSKLELALPYNGGVATFNGPSAVLQFDQASSPGYVLVSDTSDQIVAAPGSNVTVYSNANFTLPSNVDTLKLAGGATVATGNSDAAGDALWANPNAASTLIGHSLHDVFVVFNAGDTVSGQPGSNDTVYAATAYTLADNVHVDTIKLIGSAIHATGNHDAAGDQIWANPTQASTLVGESHNDLFIVFNSPDQVSDAAAGNNVVLSFADYTLPGSVNVDVLKLAPGSTATHATGNNDASGDQLWANPDVASTLTGESHNDVFVVFNPADTVVGQPGSNDTVYSLVDYTLPANVDTLKIVGPTASHATGNSDAAGDQLWSNPGVNSTLTGNSQNDVFVVFNAGDHVTGQAGANDTVYAAVNFTLPDNVNVDTLKLIGSATQATGNHDSHGDQLWANPNFTSTLTGESGNDVFLVYHSGDTVSGQAGNNTVYAAADFTLPTGVHVDTLKLIGSASHGTGNNEGDTLWGNSDPNIASTLNGGATGTDAFLVTGSGGSTINSGAGTDTFDFLPASIGNGNTINGFDTGKDVIVFNHVLFANYAAVHGAMSQVGANTVITHDANNAATLDNVNMNNLTAGNFQFS
jgi:autotransporter passenger strand-loop-strand repeat protein